MLPPVHLICTVPTPLSPDEIAEVFLDLANWPLFTGYAILPGIKSASYNPKTPEIVASIIAVTCTDNSTHTEEIVDWNLPHSFQLKLANFTRPLSYFATHFDEWTHFEVKDGTTAPTTYVTRTMDLHPRSILAYPLLWLIRPLMRKAIIRSHEALNKATRN